MSKVIFQVVKEFYDDEGYHETVSYVLAESIFHASESILKADKHLGVSVKSIREVGHVSMDFTINGERQE